MATAAENGSGIRVRTPANVDMSGITVRNCVVSGFQNSIRVTREGFRALPAGEEYDHVLEDVTLTGNHVSGSHGVGIYVDGYVTDVTITDTTITDAGSSGIYLEAGSADNLVEGNQILENGFGENGPGGQIEEVGGLRYRFWGTGREGISIDGSRRNVIRDNTLTGNSAGGIYLYTNCGEYFNSKPSTYFQRRYGATGNLITGNRLSDGVSGVWVGARMGESMLPMDCADPAYFHSGMTQITRDRAAGNTVSDNLFDNMTYGVRVEDDDTKVTGNSFSGTDEGQYAVIVGTPYRTTELGEPVSGTELTGNISMIAGNPSPYRWVDGETGSTGSGNVALGQESTLCEGKSLPRGPFVMTIVVVYEPAGSPVTPTPANLRIPPVGPQPPCIGDRPPPEPGPPDPEDPIPPDKVPPSNQFTIGGVKLNPKQGTATLSVKVPGPGQIRLRGTGTTKPEAKTARAAGTVRLTLRAKGATAGKLRRRGKAKVKATVTFTPTGGASATKKRSVTLVRKAAARRG